MGVDPGSGDAGSAVRQPGRWLQPSRRHLPRRRPVDWAAGVRSRRRAVRRRPASGHDLRTDLGAKGAGGAPGAKDDRHRRADRSMLGTDAKEVQITDLAVHPKTHNAYIRSCAGPELTPPALVRVDGAGKTGRRPRRSQDDEGHVAERAGRGRGAAQSADGIDHRHGVRGRQARCRRPRTRSLVETPHCAVSVRHGGRWNERRIYHGNHGQFETRSPVVSFVPYKINNTANLIAATPARRS